MRRGFDDRRDVLCGCCRETYDAQVVSLPSTRLAPALTRWCWVPGNRFGLPAQIREVIELNGPDIYREATVTRQVYILTGSFPQSGSSGSAVVDVTQVSASAIPSMGKCGHGTSEAT